MKNAYREYKNLNLTNIADEVRRYWEENEIFGKSLESRKTERPSYFTKGHLQQTALPEYIMSCQGPLRTHFADTILSKVNMYPAKPDGILTAFP